jgi:tetratricopeptide (TPR) repeat protein
MADYAVARLDEIEELSDGREPYRPVRHHLGIRAFGVNAWTARAAGDRILNEHAEDEPDSDEELYLVLQGHAAFELDGDRVDAPAGTFVFVRPGVKRTAFAQEPGTTVVAIGAKPGKAYEASGWELWAPLASRYQAGEHAEVAERLRALVEGNPQYALLFYNLACCESLTGRTSDALDHLRQAIELSEQVRGYAREDSDLDAIRGEPAFEQLIGARS